MSINYMPCDQSKLASGLKCKTKKEMGLRSMYLELFEGNADNKTSLSPVKKSNHIIVGDANTTTESYFSYKFGILNVTQKYHSNTPK
jgi:hypothetical protein